MGNGKLLAFNCFVAHIEDIYVYCSGVINPFTIRRIKFVCLTSGCNFQALCRVKQGVCI